LRRSFEGNIFVELGQASQEVMEVGDARRGDGEQESRHGKAVVGLMNRNFLILWKDRSTAVDIETPKINFCPSDAVSRRVGCDDVIGQTAIITRGTFASIVYFSSSRHPSRKDSRFLQFHRPHHLLSVQFEKTDFLIYLAYDITKAGVFRQPCLSHMKAPLCPMKFYL